MELALAFSLRASRTDKLGPLFVPMLIEKLDHRRHHCKVEKKEESDTSVLTISPATARDPRRLTLYFLSLNHRWKGRYEPRAPHKALVLQYKSTVLGWQ
jgi:hypothetical protein